jgi:superoxide reductase
MRLMKENTTDGATEKHVPVIEKVAGGIKVAVGSVAHPMEEKHYIEWIESSPTASLSAVSVTGPNARGVFPVEAEKRHGSGILQSPRPLEILNPSRWWR